MNDNATLLTHRVAVSPGEALFLAGYSSSPTTGSKSASNLLWRNCYPFPIRELRVGPGRPKRVVLVEDIARVLRGEPPSLAAPAETSATVPARRPGRPRKGAGQ